MGDHATKNENESESEPILNESNLLENLNEFWVNRNMGRFSADIAHEQALKAREEVKALEKRVKALEKALMHRQHTNTDDGSRHQNDGGWFD